MDVTFSPCVNEIPNIDGVQAVTMLGRSVTRRFFGAPHRDNVI